MAKKGAQIIAFIALFCIIVSVISTGILVILGGNNNQTTEPTPEQLEELQQIINTQSGIVSTGETIIQNKQGRK